MRHRRIWPLLLSLSLLLFPVSPHRTALSPPSPGTLWRWPVDPPVQVLRRFDPPEQRWLPGHLGVDLAAEPGQPVYAAGPGRVRFAGRVAGVGVVSVSHGELHTTYLPVEPSVVRGDPVTDRPVGTLAAEPQHCPAAPCLHWGLLRGSAYLDPLSLLGHGQIRLLPRQHPVFPQQPRHSNLGANHSEKGPENYSRSHFIFQLQREGRLARTRAGRKRRGSLRIRSGCRGTRNHRRGRIH